MNPLRTVGGRLSLGLLFVVAGALAIVYLVVVPQLEGRLIDAKLSQLRRDAETVSLDAVAQARGPFIVDWEEYIPARAQALNIDARVVMFRFTGRGHVRVYADTAPGAFDVDTDPILLGLADGDGGVSSGVATRRGSRFAEVAVPVRDSFALTANFFLSAPLDDSLQTVALVERRLLLAGLIALAIALVVGFAAARMFARRVRRLERAADRIAAGHFDQAVIDTGRDEIAELAAAFERMRQRLANLEHARREFIANASHELRTPVFALAGLLELLGDEELDEETRREFITTAREQSDRLTKLATELLDLSRLDAGRIHLERDPVDLDELARALGDEFRAVAQSNDHPLEVLGAPATAVGDEQRVLQVGRILVENALVHTPADTTVRVRTRVRDGRALLSVEDTGPGIAPEHWEHVFERFYRVNGAVTSGGGLGLAIARELTELMGGEMALDSRPGRTVFTLALPLASAREPVAVA